MHLKNKNDVEGDRRAREEAAAAAQAQEAQKAQAEIELQKMKAAAQGGRALQAEMEARNLGGDIPAAMGGYV